jgi:glycosyltransferase involved in cell wall biosynthesis
LEPWYLAPSTPLEAMLMQQIHIARGRTHVAHLGVLAGREQVMFGPVDDCAAVFCTTPFVPEGRVDDLLEATAILRRRGRQIMLFLAGEGPMEAQLRRLLRLHDLSTAVTLAQPSGDLTPAMQSADLFVEPSTEEAIVLDTLEAMAAGVPVACYPNAVSDHLIDGETAAISKAVTPDALAECMERALFEAGMGQRIAQGGLNHVRTHHTVTGMARCTADTYREATRSRATFSIREG